jgi:6-phosphogluconate dehydrogenase
MPCRRWPGKAPPRSRDLPDGAGRALARFGGRVSDSGEGRWTIAAANDEGVPAHVLTASLFEHFASRGRDLFQNKVLSAMRYGFGGHVEKAGTI